MATAITDTPADLLSADGFERVVETNRDAIRMHCYRMLGSIHEAEDATQDTFIKAWSKRATFTGDAAVRTWLYRIATNSCLDRIRAAGRQARPLSPGASDALADGAAWITPVPTSHATVGPGPEESAEYGDSLRLAFVAALQTLGERDRACVILKDVVGWSADEIAAALDTTRAAVNSALQRARAKLAKADAPVRRPQAPGPSVVDTWLRLWARDSMQGLGILLAADARINAVAPLSDVRGASDVLAELMNRACGAERGVFEIIPTEYNGQIGFAVYRPVGDGTHRAHGAFILEEHDGLVTRVHAFDDPRLVTLAGLPDELSDARAMNEAAIRRLSRVGANASVIN